MDELDPLEAAEIEAAVVAGSLSTYDSPAQPKKPASPPSSPLASKTLEAEFASFKLWAEAQIKALQETVLKQQTQINQVADYAINLQKRRQDKNLFFR